LQLILIQIQINTEASHEQVLFLVSREHTINITKEGNITQKVISPTQSPIPFSITTYSSTGKGGTRESAGYNVYACKTCNKISSTWLEAIEQDTRSLEMMIKFKSFNSKRFI